MISRTKLGLSAVGLCMGLAGPALADALDGD
jgi:hypothetical protein